MKLIVGLGNPGRSYARHRHNIGFMVVDELARRHGLSLKKKVCDAVTGKGVLDGVEVLLAKPQTFMNRSGYSVGPLFEYFKCDYSDLIVVHDDIDLPLGKLKITRGAGHGGHNGVRSVIEELGGQDFYRVRIGVGRPPLDVEAADHVLQTFSEEEREEVEAIVHRAADAVGDMLTHSLRDVQQRYHKDPFVPE